jgi:GlpG protein
VASRWDSFLDFFEESGGPVGRAISVNLLRRLTIEAPVVVGFCFACVIIHILNDTVMPGVSFSMGVDDTFSGFSLLQYVRLLSHIFAHDGINHLKGNMINLLLVGPSAEHVFGSYNMLIIFLLVAVTSAFAHIFIGGVHTRQLGASGVCFALILLNSLVSAKAGKIPLSFLLTAGLWITDEVVRMVFSKDGVSHHAHLTGAIVGTLAGYELHRRQEQEKVRRIASAWRSKKSK